MTQIQAIENMSQPDLAAYCIALKQRREDEKAGFQKMAAQYEKALEDVITERDSYHEQADNLAHAISKYFGVDIGEHTSANNPWAVALEVISDAAAAPAARAAKQAQWIEHCNITDIPDAVLTPSGLAIKSEQADIQEPAASAFFALRYAAKVIELYDDATMRADYMLSSTDCAEILEALAEYFTVHPRVSGPQVVQVYKVNDISGSVDSVLAQPCTCPSGDGSLRWPCPVHPPEI